MIKENIAKWNEQELSRGIKMCNTFNIPCFSVKEVCIDEDVTLIKFVSLSNDIAVERSRGLDRVKTLFILCESQNGVRVLFGDMVKWLRVKEVSIEAFYKNFEIEINRHPNG